MESNLSPEQRHELFTMYHSGGWALMKKELSARRSLLARDLLYGTIREQDDIKRGGILVIDSILAMEAKLLTPPPVEAPEQQPEPPTGNRYDV